MFGIQNHLNITVCANATEAAGMGYNYTRDTHLPIEIERALVVKNGTVEGNPTVDLILVDENGQRYVVIITGKLLKMLPL